MHGPPASLPSYSDENAHRNREDLLFSFIFPIMDPDRKVGGGSRDHLFFIFTVDTIQSDRATALIGTHLGCRMSGTERLREMRSLT